MVTGRDRRAAAAASARPVAVPGPGACVGGPNAEPLSPSLTTDCPQIDLKIHLPQSPVEGTPVGAQPARVRGQAVVATTLSPEQAEQSDAHWCHSRLQQGGGGGGEK